MPATDDNKATVSEYYLRHIRPSLDQAVRARISTANSDPTEENREIAKFLAWLLPQVDLRKYEELKSFYSADDQPQFRWLKYLDPITWFERSLAMARRLNLHTGSPKRIVDIGTGAGHFLVVCRFYGHEAIGTEVPDYDEPARVTHLYNGLSDLYGTTRIKHRIQSWDRLHWMPTEVDLTTAISVAFNRTLHKQYWTVEQWQYFLAALKNRVLKPDGALFMSMVRGKAPPETWDYLKSIAEWHDPDELMVYIRDFSSAEPTT